MVRRKKIIGVVGVIMLGALLASLLTGRVMESQGLTQSETYEDLKVFSEILSQVQKNYVEQKEPNELIRGAINGMLKTLDPHSSYMSPEMFKEVQVDTRGKFGGLGIQISIRGDKLIVIAPIEGTPAERVGIKAGDHISAVDQLLTKDMSLLDAVNKMRGRKGTQVTLTILREGAGEPLEFTITRDIIKIKSVRSEMLEDQIGLIRISQFQERTGKELSAAVRRLQKEGMRSLILDLRNNPGGLLNSAVVVAEQFLEEGREIVSIEGRGSKQEEYVSSNAHPLSGITTIVLVNEGSASASEIVAGALQDWKAAVVLGTTTFGKGSVQTIIPLSDGSGLRLTTARYYTPDGRSIQNTGILPDIVVKPHRAGDGQAVPPLREEDLEGHLKNESADPGSRPSGAGSVIRELPGDAQESSGEPVDFQLQQAIEQLKRLDIFNEILAERPEAVMPEADQEILEVPLTAE